MPKLIDLTGKKFGRWTVISRSKNNTNAGQPKWDCVCECGTNREITGGTLRSGNSKSCSCLQKEVVSTLNSTHKLSQHPLHKTWNSMHYRCVNPKSNRYKNYGGRGISVCPQWSSLQQFIDDMGEKPTSLHTLDRKDNDKNYSPRNCHWATPKEQSRNKTSTALITIGSVTKCQVDWCKLYNRDPNTFRNRVNRFGWSPLKALETPLMDKFKAHI